MTCVRYRLLLALLPLGVAACGTAAAGTAADATMLGDVAPQPTAIRPAAEATESLTELQSPLDPTVAISALSVVRAIADAEGRVALMDETGHVDVHDDALLSSDGRTAVVIDAGEKTTVVRWIRTATAEILSEVELSGALDAVVTDPRAEFVGLVDAGNERAGDEIAPGRETTEIIVADRNGEQFRTRLGGNVVPEAFSDWTLEDSTTPAAAFVIEYSPPLHPTHYRVRLLDLATATLGLPLDLRDKTQSVDQLMAGISRSSVVASDSGLLFTLYRGHHDEGGGNYAFIHTLAFGNGVWCLEVPTEMDLAAHPGAIAVTPDGDHLVAVSSNGTIASIAINDILDFEAQPIFGEAVTVAASATDHAPAITTAGRHLLVGVGTTLVQLDPLTLTVVSSTTVPIRVEAIASAADTVVVAGNGRLLLLDEQHAVRAESQVPAGLGTVARVVTDQPDA